MKSDSYIQNACNLVNSKMVEAFDTHKGSGGLGIEPHQLVAFILDKYISGDFYGMIGCKFLGAEIRNPEIIKETFKLENSYQVTD